MSTEKTQKHKKEPMAYCYIMVNGEKVPWSAVNLRTKETTIYLCDEEADMYEQRIMENIGENVSRYMANHPESGFWDASN